MDGLSNPNLPETSTETLEIILRQLLPQVTDTVDDVNSITIQASKPIESDQQSPPVITSASAQSFPPQTAQTNRIVSHRQTDVDRLDYFAFSHNADAYCHGVAAEWTRGTILTIANKTSATAASDSVKKIPSPEPTPEELHQSPDHTGAYGYLWIGMIPSDESLKLLADSPAEDATADTNNDNDKDKDPKKKQTKVQGKKHRRDFTVAHSKDEEIRILQKDDSALRVVVNLKGKNVAFHKLSNRDNTSGTCTLESVKIDSVFFFRAFRNDNAKGLGERRSFFKDLFNKLKKAMEDGGADAVAKALRNTPPVAASGGHNQQGAVSGSKDIARKSRGSRPDKPAVPQTAPAKSGKEDQGTKRKLGDTANSKSSLQAEKESSTKRKRQKKSKASVPASSTAVAIEGTADSKAAPPTDQNDDAAASHDTEVDQVLELAQGVQNNEPQTQRLTSSNFYPISSLPGTPSSLLGRRNGHTAASNTMATNNSQSISSTSTLRAATPHIPVSMTSPTPSRPASLPGRSAIRRHTRPDQLPAARRVGFSSSLETCINPLAAGTSASITEKDMATAATMWSRGHGIEQGSQRMPVPTFPVPQNWDRTSEEEMLRLMDQNELEQGRIQRGIEAQKAQRQQRLHQQFRQPPPQHQPPRYLGQQSGSLVQQHALKPQPQQQHQYLQQHPFHLEPKQPRLQQQHHQLGQFDPKYNQIPRPSSSQDIIHNHSAEGLFTSLGREVISLVSNMERCNKNNINVVKYTSTMIDQLSNTPNSSSMVFQLRLGPPAPGVAIQAVVEPMFSDFMSLLPDLAQDLNIESFGILLHALQVSKKTIEYNLVRQFVYGFTRDLAKQRTERGDEIAFRKDTLIRIVEDALNVARDLVYPRNGSHRQIQQQQQQQRVQTMTTESDGIDVENSSDLRLDEGEYEATGDEQSGFVEVENFSPHSHAAFALNDQFDALGDQDYTETPGYQELEEQDESTLGLSG